MIRMVSFLSNNNCCASSFLPAQTHWTFSPHSKDMQKQRWPARSSLPSLPQLSEAISQFREGHSSLPGLRAKRQGLLPPFLKPFLKQSSSCMQTTLQPPSWGTTLAWEEEQQGKMEALFTSQSEVSQSNSHPMNTHSQLPSANQLLALTRSWAPRSGRAIPSGSKMAGWGWRGRWTPRCLGPSPQGRSAAGAPSHPPRWRWSWPLLLPAFMEDRKARWPPRHFSAVLKPPPALTAPSSPLCVTAATWLKRAEGLKNRAKACSWFINFY